MGIRSLGWEDSSGEGNAAQSGILAWEIPWTEEPGRLHGVAKSRTRLSDLMLSLSACSAFFVFGYALWL